jgi:methyl-accepting chemotaxis protein
VRGSIRTKLLANVGAALVLMVALGVFALNEMSALNGRTKTIANRALPTSDILGTLQYGIADYSGGVSDYQLVETQTVYNSPAQKKALAPVLARITADQKMVDKAFAGYRALHPDATGQAYWNRVHQAWTGYLTGIAKVTAMQAKGASEAATNAAAKTPLALLQSIPTQIASWRTASNADAAHTVAQARSTYANAKWIVVALLLAAIALAGSLGYLLARSLARRLSTLSRAAGQIAHGDLSGELTDDGADEIGDTSRAFREMVAYFKRIAGAAGQIAAGDLTVRVEPASEQDELAHAFSGMADNLGGMIRRLADAAGTIGSSSQEMAASSLEAGRTVSEISRAIGDVAEGAERQVRIVEQARMSTSETGAAADETRGAADEGVRAAERASRAMDALRESTTGVTEAIRGLAGKSEQIGGIVETITGIAGQTNLLALNAAIEAARAGEQGRGFAVVAEEVRKLAEESQHAAASIAELIGEIQGETERTVRAVEDGARTTAESAETVEEARLAFQQIGTSVEAMTGRIAQIVESTSEVAAVAEQSSAATEQVSASTEETSNAAARIADNAQALADTADELQQLVGQFRL